MALFVGLMVAGVALAWRRAPLFSGGFALLLIAQVGAGALRPAHPALGWHLFHAAVALWLLVVTAMLAPASRRARDPAVYEL